MGFNLNKLKKQYGVGSAAKLGYAGARNPGDTFSYDEDAVNAAEEAITEAAQLEAYNAQKANYTADQSAYNDYTAQYDQRLQGVPMYANKQFAGSKRVAPNTVNEMYEKYLGRENENNPARAPGSNVPDWVDAPEPGSMTTQVMGILKNPLTGEIYETSNGGYSLNKNATQQVSDAERNAFIRNAEQEMIDRGINNTGNQYMMNQMGNYYGNVLGAPVNTGNVYGYGGAPITAGGGTAGGGTAGGGTAGGTVNSDGVLVDANGVPIDFGLSPIDINLGMGPSNAADDAFQVNASNQLLADNSAARFDDGTQYVNNDQGDFMNIFEGAEEYRQGFVNDLNAGLGNIFGGSDDSTTDTESFFSGGGDDGIGEWGAVGDFFGGIGDSIGITNYSGINDEYNEYNMGGPVKGYANGTGDEVIEEETVIAPDVTLEGDPLDMDALVEETITPTPAMSPNVLAMRTMLQNSQGTRQDSGISSLGQEYKASTDAYQQAMANLAGQESKGPSESEKWFRIAEAFGKPTQSGNFFDGLGNVSGALGEIEAERRAAQSTGNQLLLENSRFGMELLKEQLATATSLQSDERSYNRRLQEMFLETENARNLLIEERKYDILSESEKRQWELDNKKTLPQTVAGKAAFDMGYTRGSSEYIKYVEDYYEREQSRRDLEIKTLSDQATRLTTPELNLAVETDNQITGQGNAIQLLQQALEVNALAYTDSYADNLAKFIAGQINSDDPQYQATEQLMNLLSKGALATLKATFGGNISDGERAANLDLQGTGSMDRESRRKIIQQALDTMLDLRIDSKARLVRIRDGSYGTRDKKVETK
jgi:hypothetical protein